MIRSLLIAGLVAFSATGVNAQAPVLAKATGGETTAPVRTPQKIVVVTGARFSYKLVQKWIDEYYKVNPDVQIIIEARGSSDPAKVDVLAEVYALDPSVAETREFINVGRYAILPVASSKSEFASVYGKKGLNKELIQQLYFHNIFADKEKQEEIKAPYTVYTRLQKAGAPIVFAKYFGFEQKDINGKGIAGSDEHLVKAVQRDSTGLSYLPLTLIYDHATRRPAEGLTVLPVDIDGNGKVSDEEKFFQNEDEVLSRLESADAKSSKNIPIEYLHLSVDKKSASPEAVAFLTWVNENGQRYLSEFGYLKPEPGRFEKAKFIEFASKRPQ
jgi:phosphate transport system substrate-binding protein